MIHLNFDETKRYPSFTDNNGIDPEDFAILKEQVDAKLGPNIQSIAISWSNPYRVATRNYYTTNYSITSAFAFGIDQKYLNVGSCGAMPSNPFYDSTTTKPYTDLQIRPAMILAGASLSNAQAVIDKGKVAD